MTMKLLELLATDLFESQNYETMFQSLLNFAKENDHQHAWFKLEVDTNIKWAKETLKKNDRIVWYLRYVKLKMIDILLEKFRSDDFLKKEKQKLIGKTGENNLGLDGMKRQIAHFLSLPVPSIQNHVWKNEKFDELLDVFTEYEDEWKATVGGKGVEIRDDDEIILNFDGGKKAWWMLARGACSDEANAMRHCGNVPSERYGDRILSFRSKIEGSDLWVPHLTFILDKNDVLGEMKGKANEKPQSRYHPYIVALLRNKIIEGIKGGGYAAYNNFSLGDLDSGIRQKLLQEKPALMSLYDLYNNEGFTSRVKDLFYSKLRSLGINIYDVDDEKRIVILEQHSSLSDFLSSYDWIDEINPIITYLDDHEEYHNEADDDTIAALDVSDDHLNRVMELMGGIDKNGLLKDADLSRIKNNEKLDFLFKKHIYQNSTMNETLFTSERFKDFLNDFIYIINDSSEVVIQMDGIEGEVRLTYALGDFIDGLIGYENDDEENYAAALINGYINRDNWINDDDISYTFSHIENNMDDEKQINRFKVFMNKIKLTIGKGKALTFNSSKVAEAIIKELENARDPNQLELPFESVINRMKKLAGLK
jgi:hypothetical protein